MELVGFQITVSTMKCGCPGDHTIYVAYLDGTEHRGKGMSAAEAITHLIMEVYGDDNASFDILQALADRYRWGRALVLADPDGDPTNEEDGAAAALVVGDPNTLQAMGAVVDGFCIEDDTIEEDEPPKTKEGNTIN